MPILSFVTLLNISPQLYSKFSYWNVLRIEMDPFFQISFEAQKVEAEIIANWALIN